MLTMLMMLMMRTLNQTHSSSTISVSSWVTNPVASSVTKADIVCVKGLNLKDWISVKSNPPGLILSVWIEFFEGDFALILDTKSICQLILNT